MIAILSSLVILGGVMTVLPVRASAHDYQRGSTDGHVLRLVAYVVHPIGIALEYGITRPVHWVASQPHLDILLGHKAAPGDVYFEWTHGDGSRSIADAGKKAQAPSQPAYVPPAEQPMEAQPPAQPEEPLLIELEGQPDQQMNQAPEQPDQETTPSEEAPAETTM